MCISQYTKDIQHTLVDCEDVHNFIVDKKNKNTKMALSLIETKYQNDQNVKA